MMASHTEGRPARSKCPSSQELEAFDTGDLTAERTDEIASHIKSCDVCRGDHLGHDAEDGAVLQALRDTVPLTGCESHYVGEAEYLRLRRDLLAHPEPVAADGLPDEMLPAASPIASAEPLPRRLGSYELLEKVGQGAMGAVYRARQVSLKRIVAVKVLAVGRWNKRQALARFRREMEAIGRLDHPHIITAHDAGEVDGIHFLATEYVEGLDLSTLVDRVGPLPVAEACELIRQAALGLEAAHQQGMVHQDVKPSNLMVTPQGHVKVLDLGLVAFLSQGSDEETADETPVGTPEYMAPERWKDPRCTDIRADVYSLGCTLFKLLAGFAPFSQPIQTVDDSMRAHLGDAVPSLCQLRDDIPAALQRAVYRMLAKSPHDRFASPAAVAELLEPFADGAELTTLVAGADTPVSAPRTMVGPPHGRATGKSASRRRTIRTAAGAVAVAAAVLSGMVIYAVTNVGTVVIRLHRDDVRVTLDGDLISIKSPRDEVRVTPGTHLLRVEKDGLTSFSERFTITRGGTREFEVTLQPLAPAAEPPEVAPAPSVVVTRPPLRDTITQLAQLSGHTDSVPCVCISSDSTRIVSASVDRTVRLWDVSTGQELRQLTGHAGKVVSAVFSPDDSRVASASHDGTVRIWDVQTGQETHRLQGHRGWVNRVDFSPDGRRLASGGEDSVVRVWDAATGNLELSLPGHSGWIRSVAFTPDGQAILSAGNDATVVLWDLATRRMHRTYQGHRHAVSHAVASANGRYVLSGGLDRRAILWDRTTEEPLRVLLGHRDTVFAVAFLQDDHYAVTASADQTLGLWDLSEGKKVTTFIGHTDYVLSVSVSPDGRFLASSGQDKTIRIWPIPMLPAEPTS